jgi:hypothetical protein
VNNIVNGVYEFESEEILRAADQNRVCKTEGLISFRLIVARLQWSAIPVGKIRVEKTVV